MEDKKIFGEYVCKKRKEIGLTQKELAEKLFVTESAVSKWERGLSYPDITLVSNICNVLGISEGELLNGREEGEVSESQNLPKRIFRFINVYRNSLSIIYGLSLLVCFICNLAVFHTLSWFFIVLAAEMVAVSFTLVPVLVKEKKVMKTLGAFFLSLNFLFVVCNAYTEGSWFLIAFISVLFGMTSLFLPYILYNIWLPEFFRNKKTLIYFIVETLMLFIFLYVCSLYAGGEQFLKISIPIALFSLLLPWGCMIIIRYTNMNIYLKIAGCLALSSAFEFTIQRFISYILSDGQYGIGYQFNFLYWNEVTVSGNIDMIIFVILIMLTIVFGLWGTVYQKER